MENLESYFSKIKDQLTSKEDSLAILFHWGAISNNLQCVGIGKNWPSDTEVIKSDIPPENWNSNQSGYLFRYLDDKKNRFLLEIVKNEEIGFLFVYLINIDVNVSSSSMVNIDRYAGDSFYKFKTAYIRDVPAVNMMKNMITSVMKSAEEKSKQMLLEKNERNEN